MPSQAWEAQKVTTLVTFFRSLVVLTLVAFIIGPFVWGNVPAAMTTVVAMFVFLLVIPCQLLKRGRQSTAMWFFAIGVALNWQSLVVFSGGVRSPLAAGLFLIIIATGVLLSKRAAIGFATVGLVINASLTIYSLRIGPIPVIFPIPPLAALFTQALMVIFVVPPLLQAVSGMRNAIDQKEYELRRQQESREQILFQAELLEHAPDPIMAIDPDHLVTYWNRAAVLKFKIPREWAVGRNVKELLQVGDDPEWAASCAEISRLGSWTGELGVTLADGTRLRLEVVVKELNDAGGKAYCRIAGFRDVTEARQAVSALKLSEERLRLFTDAVPIGIYVLDRENKITFANQFFRAREARSKGSFQKELKERELVLRDMSGNVIAHEDYPSQRVFRTGVPVWNERFHLVTPAGEAAYFSLSAAPLKENGEVTHVIIAFDDITEKVRLEEQYLQAQKMEGIGLLAGGVAHDFNNLLMVINGSCERILRTTPASDPRRRDLLNAQTAGRRAADLTHQLLAVGRKQSGISETLSLNKLIQEFQPLLNSMLRENITLSLQLSREDYWMTADPAQINQVLMNLIINAQEAMPEGGSLDISTRAVLHQEESPSGTAIELAITDTGVGMSPETRQRIFEPFFSTKDRDRNTGLGLSTVYGIVKQSGGWMIVDSEPGKGSTFRLYFPCSPHLDQHDKLEPPPVDQLSGKVLIVEDRDDVREFLATALELEGMEVIQASNGAEALELADNCGHLDILLTDMIMPGISGKETALRLKATRPELHVILMTGYSNELMDRQNPLTSEFVLLRKPFTQQTLQATLADCLQKAPAIE